MILKKDVHRLVLVLYKIRNPQVRHRTGSPPLIIFLDPQSPHLYSTPRMMGRPEPEAEMEGAGVAIVETNVKRNDYKEQMESTDCSGWTDDLEIDRKSVV